MFSVLGNSVVPLPTLPHHNRSRNSRWRSSKPEVPIFQLMEELATRFQFIILRFRGLAIQWRHSQHCHTTTEVGIHYGRHNNVSYHFRVRSDRIVGITVGLLDPENIGLPVGIALLSCVQVKIWVLPDWRPSSWIYHLRLGRTVL